MSTVVYGLVARPSPSGSIIHLADYQCNKSGIPINASDVKAILNKISIHFNNKSTHSTERFIYHVSVIVGAPCTLIYLIGADSGLDKTTAYGYLDQIQTALLNDSSLLIRIADVGDHGLQAEIGAKLGALIMEWNNGQSSTNSGRMNELRNQVNEVKTIMTQNVERVLERGERLDQLQNRSEELNLSSQQFRTTAHQVRRHMCCQNAKWTIIWIVVGIVVSIIVILIILDVAGVFNSKSN